MIEVQKRVAGRWVPFARTFTLADDLARAVVISLFTDRQAQDGDPLPGPAYDTRGWWADTYTPTPMGSRLWLLSRAKLTQDTLEEAQHLAQEALAWLLEQGHARDVTVEATYRGNRLELTVSLTLPNPSADPLALKFTPDWS